MPKFGEDVSLDKHQVGHFGFTATSLDGLESSGYTLATIVCDRSGSTAGFQDAMEAALKASVEALRKMPTADSIMLRVLTVDDQCEEQHGFIPLADIDVMRYDGMLAPRGMTAMFDGLINAAQAAAAYGQQLLRDRFNANGIVIGITDGLNNAGKFSTNGDLPKVREALTTTQLKECLESFTSVLIGVNLQSSEVEQQLRLLHGEAGFSVPMIALKDADPKTIAKIGKFVTDSVSSTSQALGTGAASQVNATF